MVPNLYSVKGVTFVTKILKFLGGPNSRPGGGANGNFSLPAVYTPLVTNPPTTTGGGERGANATIFTRHNFHKQSILITNENYNRGGGEGPIGPM